MMDSTKITCPNCHYEIEVTEVLSSQLRDEIRREFDAEQRKKESQLVARETAVQQQLEELKRAKEGIDQQVAEKLEKERQQLSDAALKKAKDEVALELQDSQQQVADI